ncbi:hypothetical protein Q1695_013466 [Nippostrongylus brasiliensis]|nr:hypothetical protein Q1695_013466 [Nippostrongylus brasiliensis]
MSYQKQRDPRDRFPNSMEPSNGRRDDRGKGHRGSEPEYKYLVRADDLPPSHDHYHEDGPEPNTKPKVTDLEKASKSNRTFLKHAPTKETIDERETVLFSSNMGVGIEVLREGCAISTYYEVAVKSKISGIWIFCTRSDGTSSALRWLQESLRFL